MALKEVEIEVRDKKYKVHLIGAMKALKGLQRAFIAPIKKILYLIIQLKLLLYKLQFT